MSEQDEKPNRVDPIFRPFVDHWTACLSQANEATKIALSGIEPAADPLELRRRWFAAVSAQTDRFLRSAPFLQMMKTHIEALLDAKDGADHPTHGGGSDDLRTFGLQTGFADRLNQLDSAMRARLNEMERRISALENPNEKPDPSHGWDQYIAPDSMAKGRRTPPAPATPHEVVYKEGTLRLLRYTSDLSRISEPIVICFALVNRPYILDLRPTRSVIGRLLDRGFDVYLIDWGVPTDADHGLRLEDYIRRLMRNAVDAASRRSGIQQVNLLGYCMGGTMATMFTALYQERVRSLVLLAAPIDFSGDEALLHVWSREDYFDVDKLIDTYGNCPGEFLQYCFQLTRPVQNVAEKYLLLSERSNDAAFVEDFLAMEQWANDSIPVAGETFREFIKMLYQQNRLVKNQVYLGGMQVKLDAIKCPLLMLVAGGDHLVPARSTLALKQHVSSTDIESYSIGAGHVGLAVSSKAHRELWPKAADWIAQYSTTRYGATQRRGP